MQRHHMCVNASLVVEQVIQDTSGGSSKLGVGTLMGTAVPLIQQMLIDGKVAEGGGHELKVCDHQSSQLNLRPPDP